MSQRAAQILLGLITVAAILALVAYAPLVLAVFGIVLAVVGLFFVFAYLVDTALGD